MTEERIGKVILQIPTIEIEEVSSYSHFSNDFLTEKELKEIFSSKCEDSRTKFTDKLFQRFCKHYRKRECVKILSFESCGVGPKCTSYLSKILLKHSNFRIINLSGNPLGEDGASELTNIIRTSPYLISIDVSSCSLSDKSCAMFFDALADNKSIVYFNISSVSGVTRNSFGEKTIAALDKMLEFNLILNELNISQTEIPPTAVKQIAHGLQHNTTLEILDISNNNCRSTGAIQIMNALKHSHLKELNFSNNHIKDDVAVHFNNFLQVNKYLKKLDLSNNSFTHKFITAIAVSILNNKTLEDLNLSKNAITGRCMDTFGTALGGNGGLKRINIAACQIDSAGFREFCARFNKNTEIESFICNNNQIQDAGIISFSDVIRMHPKLREIDFEFCEITDNSTVSLFSAVGASNTITKVNVKNNLIHNGEAVQQAIMQNKKLICINFDYNDIDYKTTNDINKLIALNVKNQREIKEGSYEEICERLKQTTIKLREVREKIIDERSYSDVLNKQYATSVDQKREKTEYLNTRTKELTAKLEKVTAEAEEFNQTSRMKSDTLQTEIASLTEKVDKLDAIYKVNDDRLKTTTKKLSDVKKSNDGAQAGFEIAMSVKQDTFNELKARYLAAQASLKEKYKIIKAALQQAAAQKDAANQEAKTKKGSK